MPLRRAFISFRHWVEPYCFYLVLLTIAWSPVIYWAAVNSFGDSTDYFFQSVESAEPGPDGRNYIYVGDNIRITAINHRHRVNGSCLLEVDRVRENVGGKFDGQKHVFQHVQQQFPGDGEPRRTSWPIPPIYIRVDESWFDDPTAIEQEMDIYTAGTYECNPLDSFWLFIGWPRMMHDFKWNEERERTRVVLTRRPQLPK